MNNKKNAKLPDNIGLEGEDVLFKGRISEVKLDCFVDGICSMAIGGIVVLWGEGMVPNPSPIRGQLIGFNFKNEHDTEKYINKMAEVYCAGGGPFGATIYGKKAYYIKLIEE